MNKLVRNIFIFILVIIFIMAFSSSYFSHSMDNLAYVLAIGIDKSDSNNLKVSFQFSATTPIAESGSTQKTPTFINTVDASSLSNAINLMNSYLGKEVNMSHCKIIIFSEELAKEGISSEIYTLINDTQVRPSCNIVITKTDAKYYMKNTKPELENLISKYYEIFTNSSKSTGYIPNATIGDFFSSLICKACEPYAILGNVTEKGSQNIGVAVFKNDTLVGELNALETICFLSIKNKADRFLVSIPDPTNSNSFIDIYLTPHDLTKIKIDTKSGSPYIQLSLQFDGRIYSMENNDRYLNPEVLNSISSACNSYLESTFSNYLYKTSKEFHSDINGFGRYAFSNFLSTPDFNNYDWLTRYQDAFFDVNVESSIKSGMLITET